MEVVSSIARSPDFHFNTSNFSPYTTVPSSPIGDPYQYNYTNALTSPARVAAIYSHYTARAYSTPNSRCHNDNGGDGLDFTFYQRRYNKPIGKRSPEITSTDKLFERGRIRPLQERGRYSLAADSRNGRRKSRSLSPLREEGFLGKNTSPSVNPVRCGLSRKWPRLKNLLLFRSASVGRASGRGSKDPLQNYTVLPYVSSVNKKRGGEDNKMGGGGGGGGGGVGGRKTVRRGSQSAASAHEKIYAAYRAAAEEQKRKTPLPFQRHGLLGFIDLSPAMRGKNKVVGAAPFSKGRF